MMQQERDAIVLGYMNRLKASFGDADFAKFQQFLDKEITSQITTNLTDKMRPETPGGEPRPPMTPDNSPNPNIEQPKEQK